MGRNLKSFKVFYLKFLSNLHQIRSDQNKRTTTGANKRAYCAHPYHHIRCSEQLPVVAITTADRQRLSAIVIGSTSHRPVLESVNISSRNLEWMTLDLEKYHRHIAYADWHVHDSRRVSVGLFFPVRSIIRTKLILRL